MSKNKFTNKYLTKETNLQAMDNYADYYTNSTRSILIVKQFSHHQVNQPLLFSNWYSYSILK